MGRESLVSLAKSYIICTIGLQIWARFLGGEKGSQWEWDQRPLPAAGSIGNSKKSITLHLCNLLLFIKHLHIPYLQKKKKKAPKRFKYMGGNGEWGGWPHFQVGQILTPWSNEDAQSPLFKHTPPQIPTDLKNSPSFIPSGEGLYPGQMLVTLQFPRGEAGWVVWEGQ